MWRKTEISPFWLPPVSNEPISETFEYEEWLQEAIDSFDYAEEKLLELEYARQNLACIRRLQGTFVRLYELCWELKIRPVFAIVQRMRAFLSYARQEIIELNRDDVSSMFEVCSVLKECLSPRQNGSSNNGHLPHETNPPTTWITEITHPRIHGLLQWIQQRLEEVEHSQRERAFAETTAPKNHFLAELTDMPTGTSHPDELLSLSKRDMRSLQQLAFDLDNGWQQFSAQWLQPGIPYSPAVQEEMASSFQRFQRLQTLLSARLLSLTENPQPSASLFGLVVGCHDQFYLLPTSHIRDLVPASEVQFQSHPDGHCQVFWPNGKAFALYSLCNLLLPPSIPRDIAAEAYSTRNSASSLPAFSARPTPSTQSFLVLVETSQGTVALRVDQIVREMMVELLYTHIPHEASSLQGEGRLPDGQPVWLLDPHLLLREKAVA